MTLIPEPDASVSRRLHWDEVYARVPALEVSWYQPDPALCLEIIDDLAIAPNAAVIDVGGGASLLVDALGGRGFGDLTVLDISSRALDIARRRFSGSDDVRWLAADILAWQPERCYDLWCDRAVFHFLTDPADARREEHVTPGGASQAFTWIVVRAKA